MWFAHIILEGQLHNLRCLILSDESIYLHRNSLEFGPDALDDASIFRMDEFTNTSSAEDMLGVSAPPGQQVSSFVLISPPTSFPNSGENAGMGMVALPVDTDISSDNIRILRANANSNWEFVELDTRVENNMAYADTSQGGVFVANAGLNTGLVAGIVVAVFILIVATLAIGGVVIYFLVRREKWQKTKDNIQKYKTKVTRSFAKQV